MVYFILTCAWCKFELTGHDWVFSKGFLWYCTDCFNCSCLYHNYCTSF